MGCLNGGHHPAGGSEPLPFALIGSGPFDASPTELPSHLNLIDHGEPVNAAHFHGTAVTKPIPSHQVFQDMVFPLEDGFRIFPGRPTASAPTQQTTPETGIEATQEVPAASEPYGRTRERILALMRQWPTITAGELADSLEIGVDGLSSHLKKLRAEGRIQHRGPTKSGGWEVLP